MVPTVTPGKMNYQAVLSSEGLEFKEALKNTWDVLQGIDSRKAGEGLVKDLNTTPRTEKQKKSSRRGSEIF